MISSLLYTGKIRHRRFFPKSHRFSYPLFMFCFDIGAIEATFKNVPFVSVEKWNWFAYYRKNYVGELAISLDQSIRNLVAEKSGCVAKGKIFLLTHLACLGYCINPISIYFVFNDDNTEIALLVLEVTNTPWHEKHLYFLSDPYKPKNNVYQYRFKKELHVSPLMAMEYEYQLNLKLDNNNLIVHMQNFQNGEKHFDATLALTPVSSDAAAIKKIFWQFPLMTYRVVIPIYWQALKLWLKGIPFYTHPKKSKGQVI